MGLASRSVGTGRLWLGWRGRAVVYIEGEEMFRRKVGKAGKAL